ncbi:MAG: hypothetical protein KDA77_20975, partial [Planctomycetaceae bacterium]|nr:hypothetical protein [Planctomycetaceae bacterium]
VKQAGINFGAPGDRRAENGTLWLDFPSVGGQSPDLEVMISNPKYERFRHHALKVKEPLPENGLNWVAASGIINPEKITIALKQREKQPQPDGIPIAGVEDDAEEDSHGEVKLHSSDLELGLDGGDPQVVALRFSNIPLSAIDELESATIQFTVDETGKSPSHLKIQAEDSANAKPFLETKQNLSARKRTQAAVEWSTPPWLKAGANGPEQTTPDLTPLLKEILQKQNWKPGNSICFLFTGTGTRIAKSYKGAKSGSARLILKTRTQGSPEKTSLAQTEEKISQNRYTIKLTFTEPDESIKPGQRRFRVRLQGETVLDSLDIIQEAGESMRCLVKEFSGIPVNDFIEIEFESIAGSETPPVISGIEVIHENGE